MQGFKNPDRIGQFDQLNQEPATSPVKKKCIKPVKISQKLEPKANLVLPSIRFLKLCLNVNDTIDFSYNKTYISDITWVWILFWHLL